MEEIKIKLKHFFEDKIIGIAIFIIVIGLLIFVFSLFSSFINFGEELNPDLAEKYGSYIGGVVGSLFTLGSAILFYSSIKDNKNVIEFQNLILKFNKLDENINTSLKYKLDLNSSLNIFLKNSTKNPDPFQILLNRLIFIKNTLESSFENKLFFQKIKYNNSIEEEEYLKTQITEDINLYYNILEIGINEAEFEDYKNKTTKNEKIRYITSILIAKKGYHEILRKYLEIIDSLIGNINNLKNIEIRENYNKDGFFTNYKQQIQIKIKSTISTSEIYLMFYLYYYMLIDQNDNEQVRFFRFLNFYEVFKGSTGFKLWENDFDDLQFLFDKNRYNLF